jgi:hypothetical protein
MHVRLPTVHLICGEPIRQHIVVIAKILSPVGGKARRLPWKLQQKGFSGIGYTPNINPGVPAKNISQTSFKGGATCIKRLWFHWMDRNWLNVYFRM